METLRKFRFWTTTLKFHVVKQNRNLYLGNVFCMKHNSFSQIPDAQKILEKFYAMKSAEIAYKNDLLNELISECIKDNSAISKENRTKKESIIKSPIQVLQKCNMVSSIINITDELLSYLEPFPFDKNRIWEKEKTGKINLYFIKNSIEKEYLAWKYQVNVKEIEYIFTRLKFCLYDFKSLRSLKKIVLLLETMPEVQKQSVAEKIYHINQKPFDLNNVINFQNKIAGITWHIFPYISRKILKHSHQHILFVVSILEDLKFTERQIQIGLPFLASEFTHFLGKLNVLLGEPELEKYRNEPDFLQLLYFRSDVLSSLTKSSGTGFKELIELINISINKVQKRVISRKSVEYLISQFFKVDKSQVIKVFSCPNFKLISEQQIYETLTYLKNVGFTSKEVEESLAIIFYPSYYIARTLDKIKDEDESLEKIGFSDGCVLENNFFTNGTKEKRKLLQLCLYFMEKPFHFSGDGTWFTRELDDVTTT